MSLGGSLGLSLRANRVRQKTEIEGAEASLTKYQNPNGLRFGSPQRPLSSSIFMFSIIPLPANFVASTTAIMAEIVNDLSGYFILIIGTLLAVTIAGILVNALRK